MPLFSLPRYFSYDVPKLAFDSSSEIQDSMLYFSYSLLDITVPSSVFKFHCFRGNVAVLDTRFAMFLDFITSTWISYPFLTFIWFCFIYRKYYVSFLFLLRALLKFRSNLSVRFLFRYFYGYLYGRIFFLYLKLRHLFFCSRVSFCHLSNTFLFAIKFILLRISSPLSMSSLLFLTILRYLIHETLSSFW